MKKITSLFCSLLMITLLSMMLHLAVQTSDAATGASIAETVDPASSE
jgi:hypothetical protein